MAGVGVDCSGGCRTGNRTPFTRFGRRLIVGRVPSERLDEEVSESSTEMVGKFSLYSGDEACCIVRITGLAALEVAVDDDVEATG